jgi:hypothetical protein
VAGDEARHHAGVGHLHVLGDERTAAGRLPALAHTPEHVHMGVTAAYEQQPPPGGGLRHCPSPSRKGGA